MTFDPSRRRFLLTAAGGLALGAAALGSVTRSARAAAPVKPSKIRDVEVTKLGTTITMDLESAPFPAKGSSYKDPTVIVFVPRYFRVHSDMRVDTLVHFHGYRDTAEEAMKRHQLREQLVASKQNAILVFPQGPVRSEDMSGGKLDEPGGLVNLLTEVRETLQSRRLQVRLEHSGIPNRARIGKCILSAHSGGFRVMSYCLEVGGFNVNEVYLFDALYGRTDIFRDWLQATYAKQAPDAERHKVISFYAGDGPTTENRRLMWFLDKAGIGYVHEQTEGTELSRREITKSRAVFVKTSSGHDQVLFRTNALRDCLYASCLTRTLKSDWFKDPDAPRIGPPK